MTHDLTWQLAPHVRAAFSTRADGDQRQPTLRETWLRRQGVDAALAVPEQVHGVQIARADAARWFPGVDGLVVTPSVAGAVVFGADCPGLVIWGPEVVVVAHCGWRGVAGGLPQRAVQAYRDETGADPDGAFIGPGIDGAHYEVDNAVLSARVWPDAALRPGRPDHAWLDVPTTIVADLAQVGITSIAACGISTAVHPALISYRREGPGCVQALAVWRV